jgi:hypothetical protein
MTDVPPPIVTQEIRIVDAQGHARILISAKSGAPTIIMLRDDGVVAAEMALDGAGRPSIKMANPDGAGPTVALAIDDKGAHMKLDRPGGASGYLFLNNAGASGIVMVDTKGIRRINATVAQDGTARIERLDDRGVPLP